MHKHSESDAAQSDSVGMGMWRESRENSDDGNTLNVDVCSRVCKVESEWECLNYGVLKNRSYCAKKDNGSSGFCGDGVVNGNEQCDDGGSI